MASKQKKLAVIIREAYTVLIPVAEAIDAGQPVPRDKMARLLVAVRDAYELAGCRTAF